ncbi:efflux RND transporter periplasmic adaptor subunit [Pedobacter immunditicola]|uniref:efflux RND transporter periplasmic adaptor subunit n=1 Tax=Pedobacter immunditicola TaxID=3133440 RepID=UPI0030AFC760
MKTITLILSISILTISILLSSCSSEKADKTPVQEQTVAETNLVQLTPVQIKNAGIVTGRPEKRELHNTLSVNGVVSVPPENTHSISIPLGGYVKSTRLVPGMMVKRGSVLGTIEDQQYVQLQRDYLTAKNNLKLYEADFVRQKALNQTKATSDKVFQQTEREFDNQKIQVSALAEQLRLIGIHPSALTAGNISRTIKIYAPIDGYVAKVNVNTGKYVNGTDVLFELINPQNLQVNLTVLENDASKLKVGQQIMVTTNKGSGQKYNARVKLITPNIGQDHSTSVWCTLEKHDQQLLPGTFVTAVIQLSNDSVLAVPDDAVVKWDKKFYVFTDEGSHKYSMLLIEPGILSDGYTEVKSELPAKDIVVKNAYALLMKLKNGEE